MIVRKTKFKDLFIIKQINNIDNRGVLRETFNNKILKKKFIFEYCTTSKQNVFRGFHFQTKNKQRESVPCTTGSTAAGRSASTAMPKKVGAHWCLLRDKTATLLARLCEPKFDEWTLRQFELALLEALGYGLDLLRDSAGEMVRAELDYRFIPAEGFRVMTGGEAARIPGRCLLSLASGEASDEARGHARQISRQALRFLLGGREIRSRELFGAGRV